MTSILISWEKSRKEESSSSFPFSFTQLFGSPWPPSSHLLVSLQWLGSFSLLLPTAMLSSSSSLVLPLSWLHFRCVHFLVSSYWVSCFWCQSRRFITKEEKNWRIILNKETMKSSFQKEFKFSFPFFFLFKEFN